MLPESSYLSYVLNSGLCVFREQFGSTGRCKSYKQGANTNAILFIPLISIPLWLTEASITLFHPSLLEGNEVHLGFRVSELWHTWEDTSVEFKV